MSRPLACGRLPRAAAVFTLAAAVLALGAASAGAQGLPSLDQLLPAGGAGSTSGRIVQMVALLTVLSVAPGILIMVTSFTRFVIAFSFLRSGLGLQTTPANLVLISLSLFMTFYVMGPTFERAWQEGVVPLTEGRISEQDAFEKISDPFREFMLANVRGKDLQLFADLSARQMPDKKAGNADADAKPDAARPEQKADEKMPMRVLVPAFMISELRRGFEIGFLIVLPFLIIDMIVATLVMSMGMMMMPPVVLSLPFKILFFILIDGWNLLVGGLIRSFL